MPHAIAQIAQKFQKDPKMVQVVKKELTVPKVTQYYYEVKPRNKVEVMCRLLDLYSPKLSVAFLSLIHIYRQQKLYVHGVCVPVRDQYLYQLRKYRF